MRQGSALLAGLSTLSAAAAQPCEPHWSAAFSPGLDGHVASLASFDDGSGPSLYAGGTFVVAGGVEVNRVGRFDGAAWHALGSGVPGPFNSHGIFDCCSVVSSLTGASAGGQPVLYIGGDFIIAGGLVAESIAGWRGGAWLPMAGGLVNTTCMHCAPRVYCAVVFDDGSGPALHIAGSFTGAPGVEASCIAKWSGTGWQPLGAGLSRLPAEEQPFWVRALAVFDDGGGPALYAAGSFSRAGAADAANIARWDGQAWSALGGGITQPAGGPVPTVNALAVFDDGRGPALYAAGYFQEADRRPARHIARWDGSDWSALGAGVGPDVNDQVHTLAVFDDGSGAALYAGGKFEIAGGIPAANVARWDGVRWSALGAGVDGSVLAMAVHTVASRPALYIGGEFASAGGMPTPWLARWEGCPGCYANCDGSTAEPTLNVNDFVCFQARFAAGDPYANCNGSTTPPALNVSDFICFLTRYSVGCP